ncbi:MAG: hypothetical protein SGPRY_009396 [Prymnesium sp.]
MRSDPAAVALSLQYARQSQLFVVLNDSSLPQSKISLEVRWFSWHMRLYERAHIHFQFLSQAAPRCVVEAVIEQARWYAGHIARYSKLLQKALPTGYLTLTYEELIESPERSLAKVFGALAEDVARTD